MFPFSSILSGRSRLLFMKSLVLSQLGGWNNRANVGFRIDTDNNLYSRRTSVYTPQTNSWIHEDSKGQTDAADFETRVFNIDLSSLGQGDFFGETDEGWHTLLSDHNFWVTVYGSEFQGFRAAVASGEYSIREIANPSNIASGTFNLTATYEGQS